MSSRTWLNIPDDHQFTLIVTHIAGSENFSAAGVYDPVGPPIRHLTHADLVQGTVKEAINAESVASLSVRYVDQSQSSTVRVTARVEHTVSGVPHPNLAGDSQYERDFQGDTSSITLLDFFLVK